MTSTKEVLARSILVPITLTASSFEAAPNQARGQLDPTPVPAQTEQNELERIPAEELEPEYGVGISELPGHTFKIENNFATPLNMDPSSFSINEYGELTAYFS